MDLRESNFGHVSSFFEEIDLHHILIANINNNFDDLCLAFWVLLTIFQSFSAALGVFSVYSYVWKIFLKNGPILASFSVYFSLFNMLQFKFKFKLKKA